MGKVRPPSLAPRTPRRWRINIFTLLPFFFAIGVFTAFFRDQPNTPPILSPLTTKAKQMHESFKEADVQPQEEPIIFDPASHEVTTDKTIAAPEPVLAPEVAPPQPVVNLNSAKVPDEKTPSVLPEDKNLIENVVNPDLKYNKDGVAKSDQFPALDSWDEGRQADIAFFIQVSDINLPLVPRLVERLWHERNIIVVHVDKKVADDSVDQIMQRYKGDTSGKYANVHFLPRESITYAGVSMLLNTLSAIEYLLTLPQRWDYFINLSGSDYPCTSTRHMRILLGQPRISRQRVSFLQMSYSKDFEDRVRKYRLNQVHFDPAMGLLPGTSVDTPLIHTYRANPLADSMTLDFKQHEAWIMVHRSLAKKSVRSTFARRLLVLLAVAKDPEEHFFGMLAWNVPSFNRTLARYAGRGVYWRLNGVNSGQHPYTVDSHKDEQGDYAFWKAIRNQPIMFVRKFSQPDSPLMDLIDRYKSGVHAEADGSSVEASLKKLQKSFMCHADIERYWKDSRFVPCVKELTAWNFSKTTTKL